MSRPSGGSATSSGRTRATRLGRCHHGASTSGWTGAAATSAGAQALEVFGLHEPSARGTTLDDATAQAHSPIARHAAAIGLTEVPILESAGFRIVDDHPLLPRLRLSLPPVFDLMADQEIADLLAEAPAV